MKKNLLSVFLIILIISSGFIGFDDYKFKKNSIERYLSPCDKDTSECTYFVLNYDEFTSGDKKDEINKYIMGYLLDSIYSAPNEGSNSSIENLISLFFNDYINVRNEMEGTDYPAFPWGLEINGQVLKVNNLFISYTVGYYIFTGGAHPNGYTRYMNFNPLTGEVLTVSDVFTQGFEKKLNTLLEKKARSFFGLNENEPLNEVLFEDKIEYNGNFTFNDNGIEFLYNRYEIAAYVFGEISLEIPYSDLNSILKQEYRK